MLPYIGSGGDRAAIFIENGFCSVFHSANGIIDFGCHFAFIDIGLVECFASQGNTIRFEAISGELTFDYHIISCNGAGSIDINCIIKAAAGKGGCAVTDTGALYFTAGGNISGGCDGSHSGKSAAFHAGSVIGNSMAGDRTGSGDVFAGNIFAGNIAISMQIAGCGNIFTRNIAGAGIDITTAGQDVTAIGIYAAIGCYLAVCIDRKLSIRPFDGTISIESRFSSIRRIAAGKYAIRCNDGTILAHFDALFVHGDLIITIFVQHQCFHSRGCGAVVSGNLGNHAVIAHFEIILGIGFLYIGVVNYLSLTISGSFEGIVCFSGMGYVVDSNRRFFPIFCFHYNHIGRAAFSDICNIRRFTQYAASCE